MAKPTAGREPSANLGKTTQPVPHCSATQDFRSAGQAKIRLDAKSGGPMAAPDNAGSDGHRLRQYLSLNRLGIDELPPHSDFPTSEQGNRPSLVQFLDAVFAQVYKVDFDNGWTDHGKWGSNVAVAMPPLSNGESTASNATTQATQIIPVSVDQRTKTMEDKKTWVARRSYHLATHVTYPEIANLVSHEHALNEARYFAYLYDANEILAWSPQDLAQAVGDLTGEFKIQSVEMNIFQMFHRMPVSIMQDRVFHVLVISAHSSYPPGANPGTPFSFTVQLPIDYDSLKVSAAIMQRSHIKAGSRRYHIASDEAPGATQPTEDQKKRIGKKLTEGNYVSLELLKQAAKETGTDDKSAPAPPPMDTEYHHRWDMMTLSTARGISELAPQSVTNKEIMKAIGADVDEVLKYIAKGRQHKIDGAAS